MPLSARGPHVQILAGSRKLSGQAALLCPHLTCGERAEGHTEQPTPEHGLSDESGKHRGWSTWKTAGFSVLKGLLETAVTRMTNWIASCSQFKFSQQGAAKHHLSLEHWTWNDALIRLVLKYIRLLVLTTVTIHGLLCCSDSAVKAEGFQNLTFHLAYLKLFCLPLCQNCRSFMILKSAQRWFPCALLSSRRQKISNLCLYSMFNWPCPALTYNHGVSLRLFFSLLLLHKYI